VHEDLDLGETVEEGAIREAREETGLEVTLRGLLGCYSHPNRDPRGQVVSLVYVAEARGEPVAQDDAKNTVIASAEGLAEHLVFDHEKILQDYLRLNPDGLLSHIHAG
ncbi:NUDIX domain-containing protein, partial [Pseudomonadota bacterium]